MSLHVSCRRCGDELNEQGAILWGPPNEHEDSHKIHLCLSCYQATCAFIDYLQGLERGTIRGVVGRFVDAATDALRGSRPVIPSEEEISRGPV